MKEFSSHVMKHSLKPHAKLSDKELECLFGLMSMDSKKGRGQVDDLDLDLIISGKRFEKGFSAKDKQTILDNN